MRFEAKNPKKNSQTPIGLGSTRSVPTLRSMSLPRNSAVPALADLAHFWQHFGTDVYVAVMPVPALSDLAHFWQQFGTDVHVTAV